MSEPGFAGLIWWAGCKGIKYSERLPKYANSIKGRGHHANHHHHRHHGSDNRGKMSEPGWKGLIWWARCAGIKYPERLFQICQLNWKQLTSWISTQYLKLNIQGRHECSLLSSRSVAEGSRRCFNTLLEKEKYMCTSVVLTSLLARPGTNNKKQQIKCLNRDEKD